MKNKPEKKEPSEQFRKIGKSFLKRAEYIGDFVAIVPALKITLVYFLVSVLWLIMSDTIVDALFSDPQSVFYASLFKGFLFMIVTSIFIFWRISRELKYASNLRTEKADTITELDQTNTLFSAILESSPEIMVFSLDKNFCYTAFNNRHKYSMLRVWGQEISIGTNAIKLHKDAQKAATVKAEYERVLSGEYFSAIEEFGDTEESQSFWQKYYAPVTNKDREIIGLTCFVLNITPLRKAQDQNLYMSYHDMLTGLYNRRYCEEAIHLTDRKENLPVSVILGDVNGLKLVNDAFGHATGNKLLIKGAEAITTACEGHGIISRWGSDEYLVLLPGTSEEQANEYVKKIKLACAQSQVNSLPVDISFGHSTKTILEESILSTIKSAEDHMNKNKIVESKSMRNHIIKTIMHTLHEKNPREEAHSKRVGEICRKIGISLNLPEIEVNLLNLAGFLHDIGKIAIDDRLLSKTDKLSPDEIAILRTHPEIGCRILRSSYDIAEIAEAVLSHHERWDGSGYPKGLKGKEIPKYSRVIAIADSFDAMTSQRSYRELFTAEQAAEEIRNSAGTLYDPEIVDAFLKVVLSYEWDLTSWDV